MRVFGATADRDGRSRRRFRARRGAIRTCRAPTPTATRAASRWSGRRSSPASGVEDVTPEELARADQAARARAPRRRRETIGGTDRKTTPAPDRRTGTRTTTRRNSRAWMISDPAGLQDAGDDRRGARSARRPCVPRAAAATATTPARSTVPQDLTLYVRCITPRRARLDDAGDLRQLLRHHAGPGLRRHPLRDGARDARHPARRPAASARVHEVVHGRRARPLGRRHAGRRDARNVPREVGVRRRVRASSRPPSASGRRRTNTIEWSITFDDATTWVKPWTFGMRLTRDDEHPIFEYACHEGNEGLRGILSAARAAEREAGSSK